MKNLRFPHKYLIIIVLGLFIKQFSFAQTDVDKKMLIRIDLGKKENISLLNDMALDFATEKVTQYAEVIVRQSEIDEINRRGFTTEEIPYTGPGYIGSAYHTHEELKELMDSYARDYPDITFLDTIGYTDVMGNIIQAIKISDNPMEEEDEPAILYDGQHHANEPTSMESCIDIIEYLLSRYGIDQQVTDWVNNTEIWVVPMLNPDGWSYIVNNGLYNTPWRKNLRDNNNTSHFETGSDGVDINRNYDHNWITGGSGDFGSNTYRGPFPFSEPEARAKRDLALEQKFVFSFSYHSYGEIVIYCWSGDPAAPDQALNRSFADSVASRIPKFGGNGTYAPIPSNCTTGFSRCWMYVHCGTIEVIVETATEFIPAANDSQQIAQDNLNGALYALERLNNSMLTGHITDASTGLPISATIKIAEIYQPVLNPRTSDEMYGRYFRPLLPGVYTVLVTKDGYIPKIIPNVTISSTDITNLDISLVPDISSINDQLVTGSDNVFQLLSYPNPFSREINIRYVLPEEREIVLDIYDMNGKHICNLLNEVQMPGEHFLKWNGKDQSGTEPGSGYYFISIKSGAKVESRRILKIEN